MQISKLIELLESVKESHGDLYVRAGDDRSHNTRAVTGVWVNNKAQKDPVVVLSVPDRLGW